MVIRARTWVVYQDFAGKLHAFQEHTHKGTLDWASALLRMRYSERAAQSWAVEAPSYYHAIQVAKRDLQSKALVSGAITSTATGREGK